MENTLKGNKDNLFIIKRRKAEVVVVVVKKADKGRERWAGRLAGQTDGAAGSFWIKTVLTRPKQHGKPAVVHHLPPFTEDPKTTMDRVSLFDSLCPNKCKPAIQLQH